MAEGDSMAFFVDMHADVVRTLAFGGISGTYANVGGVFTRPIRIMIVQNYTDALCTFSFDGGNDHFVLSAGSQLVLDITSNEFQGNGLVEGVNTQMQVKGGPTTGSVYISAFYAKSN